VALITGGAATGKTVAAAQWYHSRPSDAARAWVTVEPDNSESMRFWFDVVTALHHADSGPFSEAERLVRERQIPRRQLIDIILAEMSVLDCELSLVIDDAHLLERTLFSTELAHLIEHLPSQVQLAVTSRMDPPWPLARWTARDWLIQIRQADLAFTLDETNEFFAARGKCRLSAEDTRSLWRQTEGWVASLDLAAVHIRAQSDASRAAREFSGSNRMVADLITTELIDSQPPEVAEFMLRTSILDSLDPELCDAAASTARSHEILQYLDSNLPFMIAMDSSPRYRRYHPLLLEVLRMQLLSRMPEAVWESAHSAADVCLQREDPEGAMRLLREAGDLDRAAELGLELLLHARDQGGNTDYVVGWIEPLQTSDAGRSPLVMLVYAFGLSLIDRVPEALVWIDRAERRIAADPPAYVREAALLDMLRLTLSVSTAAIGDGIEAGRRALAAVDRGVDIGPLGPRCRPTLAEIHLLVGDDETARSLLEEAPPGDEVVQFLMGPATAARIALGRGSLTDALRLADQAMTASEVLGMPHNQSVVSASLARAGVFIERNQLAEAERCLKASGETLTRSPQSLVWRILHGANYVRLAVAVEGAEEALMVVDELRGLVDGAHCPPLEHLLDVIDVRWSVESGHLKRATRILSRLADGFVVESLRARLDLMDGPLEAAMEQIDALGPTTPTQRLTAALLKLRAEASASPASCDELAVEIVELAAPEGMARLILEEGRDASRLVRQAAEGLDVPAAANLACALGGPMKARTRSHVISDLSDRERSVLRFLPTRLTNQEIGTETFMSVNTVKTHVKHIYAKLNVTSRAAAVERAQILGLI
jgi:LuxR family maltose regulon positive regulatory protein